MEIIEWECFKLHIKTYRFYFYNLDTNFISSAGGLYKCPDCIWPERISPVRIRPESIFKYTVIIFLDPGFLLSGQITSGIYTPRTLIFRKNMKLWWWSGCGRYRINMLYMYNRKIRWTIPVCISPGKKYRYKIKKFVCDNCTKYILYRGYSKKLYPPVRIIVLNIPRLVVYECLILYQSTDFSIYRYKPKDTDIIISVWPV